MTLMWVIFSIFLALCEIGPMPVKSAGEFEFQHVQEKVENGKVALERLERKPYGQCWTSAIIELKTGCRKLTEETQSRLAIAFANCHLQRSGRNTFPCSSGMTVRECTSEMDQEAFLTYTEFFTHTSDICFYLQSQIWHQRTEETVSNLVESSEKVSSQMKTALVYHEKVLTHQNKSLENQDQILKNEKKLKEALHSSTHSAKEAFAEMKLTAQQQKALFSETFDGIYKAVDKITALQSMLLGEFMTLHSIAFYITAIIVCYFFTSTPRTAGARLLLFLLLSILIILERCLVNWSTDNSESEHPESTEMTYARIWVMRKVFLVFGAVILAVCAIRFKDYAKINNEMLMSIQEQLQDLKTNQKQFVYQSKSPFALPNGQAICNGKLGAPALPRPLMGTSPTNVQMLRGIDPCSDAPSVNRSHGSSDGSIDVTFLCSSGSETETTDSDALLEESLLDRTQVTVKSQKKEKSPSPAKKTPARKSRTTTPRRRSGAKVNAPPFESPYNLRSRGTPVIPSDLDSTATIQDLRQKLKQVFPTAYVVKTQKNKDQLEGFSSDDD